MKKEKKRQKAFPAICLRIIALVLGLWLVLTGLVTWAVAEDIRKQAEAELDMYLEVLVNLNGTAPTTQAEMTSRLVLPSYLWVDFEQTFPFVIPQTPSVYDPNEVDFGFLVAAAYFDGERNLLSAQRDVLYFDYVTNEMWNTEDVSTPCGTIIWDVDAVLGNDALAGLLVNNDFHTSLYIHALRISGYWEGEQFVPATVEYISKFDLSQWPEREPWDIDKHTDLPWKTVYDISAETDRKLELIYGINTGGCTFDSSTSVSSVTAAGVTHPSLLDLLVKCAGEKTFFRQDSLTNLVLAQYRGFPAGNGTHYAYAAIQCNPLEYAMTHLWHVYLISFAAIALVVFLILRRIHDSLLYPLNAARFGILKSQKSVWLEPYSISRELLQTRQALTESENRVQQLTTALEYAKNAEENRRQLVSNLAHELKTPLAVTHSYAEGLQEGIAPEKEDHYLSVILQETERMDALVLQMLDLSRLEAGKVHLSADRFNLLDMTREVFSKLQPALEEKELQLLYPVAEPVEIAADAARITQVIENLATNAIKYTPDGGKIYVRIFRNKTTVLFSIENTCPPLSEDALEKVWESFYRADNSRSSEGTGLGLAIVQSIVSLHRGTCNAQNTADGVRFSITLPQ